MWAAHALTLSRVPLAFALLACHGDRGWAVTLIALAALTDALDGRVARWMQRHGHRHPDIGGWLDPLVDKLFVVIALVAIWRGTGGIAVVGLIAARELVLVPLLVIYVVRRRPSRGLHADPIGKAATVAQFVALAVAVSVPGAALPFAAIAGALGLTAAVHYIARELALTS